METIENVTKTEYCAHVRRAMAQTGKWMDLLRRIAQDDDATGVRVTFDTEREAQSVERKMRRHIEACPAELWGVVVERVINVVMVVPLSYHTHKAKRLSRGIRERLDRGRGRSS